MTADLAALIEQAVTELDTVTNGGSLCWPARDGRSAPSAKFLEGRWAALSELQRTRTSGSRPDEEVLARWQAKLDRHIAEGASADWIAYDTGGVEALRDVVMSPN